MIRDELLVQLVEQHFKDLGWLIGDSNIGMTFLTMLLFTCHTSGLPISHSKFPEVLRVLANLLELRNSK